MQTLVLVAARGDWIRLLKGAVYAGPNRRRGKGVGRAAEPQRSGSFGSQVYRLRDSIGLFIAANSRVVHQETPADLPLCVPGNLHG